MFTLLLLVIIFLAFALMMCLALGLLAFSPILLLLAVFIGMDYAIYRGIKSLFRKDKKKKD